MNLFLTRTQSTNLSIKQWSLFLIISFFLVGKSSAQTWDWARTGGSPFSEHIRDMAHNSQGKTVVVGIYGSGADVVFGGQTLSYQDADGGDDAFIVSYDSTGQMLWLRGVRGFDNQQIESVSMDASGNVYILGEYEVEADFGSQTLTASSNDRDKAFVAKYSHTGQFQWAKRLRTEDDLSVEKIVTNPQGDSYVTGTFEGRVELDGSSEDFYARSNEERNVFLIKYSRFGTVTWQKEIGGLENDWIYEMVINDTDELFIYGGFRGRLGGIMPSYQAVASTGDAYLAKLNSFGSVIWSKHVIGIGGGISKIATNSQSGSLWLMGRINSTIKIGEDEFDAGELDSAVYIHFTGKLSPFGNLEWTSTDTLLPSSIREFAVDDQGRIYGAGYFTDTLYLPQDTLISFGDNDALVVGMDTYGKLVWGHSAYGSQDDYIIGLGVDHNQHLLVAGAFYSHIVFDGQQSYGGEYDIFAAKLIPPSSVTTGIFLQRDTQPMRAYPNPFQQQTTLSFGSTNMHEANLRILDSQGRLVFQHSLNHSEFQSGQITLALPTSLPSGIYYAVMMDSKGESARVMLQHRAF